MAVPNFKIGDRVVYKEGSREAAWMICAIDEIYDQNCKASGQYLYSGGNLSQYAAQAHQIRLAEGEELRTGKRRSDKVETTPVAPFKVGDIVTRKPKDEYAAPDELWRITYDTDLTQRTYLSGAEWKPVFKMRSVLDENKLATCGGLDMRHATALELNPLGIQVGDRVYVDLDGCRDDWGQDMIVSSLNWLNEGLVAVHGDRYTYMNTFILKKRSSAPFVHLSAGYKNDTDRHKMAKQRANETGFNIVRDLAGLDADEVKIYLATLAEEAIKLLKQPPEDNQ